LACVPKLWFIAGRDDSLGFGRRYTWHTHTLRTWFGALWASPTGRLIRSWGCPFWSARTDEQCAHAQSGRRKRIGLSAATNLRPKFGKPMRHLGRIGLSIATTTNSITAAMADGIGSRGGHLGRPPGRGRGSGRGRSRDRRGRGSGRG
jgi:hypothetical protein